MDALVGWVHRWDGVRVSVPVLRPRAPAARGGSRSGGATTEYYYYDDYASSSSSHLLHVGGDVLVVAHVHGHALGGGVRLHLLQLGDGGRARLLEEDVRRARLDHLQGSRAARCGAVRRGAGTAGRRGGRAAAAAAAAAAGWWRWWGR